MDAPVPQPEAPSSGPRQWRWRWSSLEQPFRFAPTIVPHMSETLWAVIVGGLLTGAAAVGAQVLAGRTQASAARDAFHRQRLETKDSLLRAAYIKVLNAAERLIDAAQDLKWFPTGRPHIERFEVTSGAVSSSQPSTPPLPSPTATTRASRSSSTTRSSSSRRPPSTSASSTTRTPA